jgi:hypothetical protein
MSSVLSDTREVGHASSSLQQGRLGRVDLLRQPPWPHGQGVGFLIRSWLLIKNATFTVTVPGYIDVGSRPDSSVRYSLVLLSGRFCKGLPLLPIASQ